MDLGLADRVFIVTGGTRGLGRAAVDALVAEGARVVVCSRDEAAVRATSTEHGGPGRVLGVAGDLADPGTETRLVAAALARYERLDGALVSIGGPAPGATTAVGDDAWRAAFESVFLGAVRVARAVAKALPPEGGSIAFVLSSSVREPIPGLAVSNGLRPGLAMVAKTMADELGARGVRVNGLLPGRIDTDRVREIDASTGRPGAARRDSEAGIPLGRYGRPDEFGRVAAFVLSPAASYLTGVMLPVDGGMMRSL
jgi:3-oxoacyl-[acyl-carrier protein] reductase